MPKAKMPIFDVFTSVTDPRHGVKVLHALSEVFTVAICGVLALKKSNSGPKKRFPTSGR